MVKIQRIANLKKILRITGQSIHLLVDLLFIVLIFLAFAIRTSWFQTWAAQQVAAFLSEEWGTEVKIDKVDFVFFDQLDIEGIYVADIKNDTLAYSGLIHAEIADWSLSESFLTIERAELKDAFVYVRIYEGDTTFNFQHIVDYFASDEPKDTSSSAFDINVNTIALNNINFIFQDQNAEKLEHGMNFSDLHFTNFSGEFTNFRMSGDSIVLDLNRLQAKEKSGFILTDLTTKVIYCPTLIGLNDLRIGFNNSVLLADYFHLKTPNGGEDFSDFTNKVRFDSHLKNTRISLADVAFFVPDIWGMTDYVNVENLQTSGPIYGMKLKDIRISMLDTTLITGNLQIPDLSDFASAIYDVKLDTFRTSISDVKKLNLSPFLENNEKHIKLADNYEQAGLILLTEAFVFGGVESFVVNGDLKSDLGNLRSEYGIQFVKNENDGLYYYNGGQGHEHAKDIIVENLDLATIAGNSMLGIIDGHLNVGGRGFSEKDLNLNFDGHLNKLGLNGYTYSNINIRKGNFTKNIFDGEIDLLDDNLALVYDGKVDLNAPMYFDFDVRIDSAILTNINVTDKPYRDLFKTKIKVQIRGTSPNEIAGNVYVEDLHYKDSTIDFTLDTLALQIRRSKESDSVKIYSPYLTVDLFGKFDLSDIYPVLQTQLSYVVDNLVAAQDIIETKNEFFDLDIRLTNVNPLLQFFDDDIYIAEDSRIQSYYNLKQKRLALDVNIQTILYHGMALNDIKLENRFDSSKASIFYQVQHGKLNDSVQVRNIYFDSYIKNNSFLTNFGWDGFKGTEPALFAFKTLVDDKMNIFTAFDPSFFHLKNNKWEINNKSSILWNPDVIQLSKFKISNGNHVVNFDGKISKNPNDWLYFYVQDFELADLNGLLGGDILLSGVLNIDGGVADLYNNIRFQSLSDIKDFFINGEEVGDILVNAKWDKVTNSLDLYGNLKRDNAEKFRFDGNYWIDKEEDNIDLDLTFNQTDISFLNAFEDPELYTDIEGILDGKIKVTGELTDPDLKGDLDIIMAGVMVPMFNVGFGFSGGIKIDKSEIVIDQMSLFDQEGNRASASMQIYHNNWADFNYDVTLDMDDPLLSEKFLVMNTTYTEGSYYYGKAYISGMVNIFGYDDLVQISVDATTKKGTKLTLPMYGSSDLEEGSFIHFKEPDADGEKNEAPKIERMGMTLDMKFRVTEDAQVTIVFEPVYEDQIVAKGVGDIEIAMDDYGELTMFGKYQITDGVYNMRMKTLVREDFVIDPESTIRWTRSPYDADIDITAMFFRNLSLQDIVPPGIDRGGKKDIVVGYLIMRNTLMKPELSFHISAPNSDQEGKYAVAALTVDVDHLTKQFFAILVLQRFIPVYGTGSGGTGALGLIEDQLNTALEAISGNFNISADLSGSKSIALERQLNERITISVSGGVVEGDDTENSASSFVGDMRVEYRLNEDGSFTLVFFNESNTGNEADNGPFTQGVSMHYEETFESAKDFKLLQGFLNIFRPKDKDIRIERSRVGNTKKRPIPTETVPQNDTTKTVINIKP